MAMTVAELQSQLLAAWEEYLYHISKSGALEYRREILKRFDGDCLPNIYKWPKEYRMILFKTDFPLTFKSARQLFLFLIGNGCTPILAGRWIISYYSLLDWEKRDSMAKRKIRDICILYAELLEVGGKLVLHTNIGISFEKKTRY